MSLRPIYGHESLFDRLAGALASGRFPQATLLVGPPGVGKQRIALWAAQGLLCERGPGAPCGECPACRQILALSHPDLHWFVPIPRPKASDPDKQVEEVRASLAELMAQRRATGLYERPEGLASHSLASVRLLLKTVSLTPFRGRKKVVVLGDAERLIVQEASQEAANALLKALEEPAEDTVMILTAAEPQSLLPTIRSRTVPVRVGRVSDEAVRRFLTTEITPPPDDRDVARRVALAEGCIGRALSVDRSGSDAERRAKGLFAAVGRGPAAWAERALAQAPWSARGDFTAMLDEMEVLARAKLERTAAAGDREAAGRWVSAVRHIETTRADAQGNVNPQLALAVLARELETLV